MVDNISQGLNTSNMACAYLERNFGQWNETLSKPYMHWNSVCVSGLGDLSIGLRQATSVKDAALQASGIAQQQAT